MTAVLHQLHGQEVTTIENNHPDDGDEDQAVLAWERKLIDVAAKREARWQARLSRIEADTRLNPRLKELFLDRTLWGIPEQIKFLNVSDRARIRVLSRNRHIYRSYGREFPAVLPSPDAYLGGRLQPRPAIEAGRLRQWAWDDHRVIFDPNTGTLVTNPIWRGGRRPNPGKRTVKPVAGGPDARRATRGVPKAEQIAQARAAKAAKINGKNQQQNPESPDKP